MLTTSLSSTSRTLFILLVLSSIIGGCSNTGDFFDDNYGQHTKQAIALPEIRLKDFSLRCNKSVFSPAQFRERTLKLRVFEGSPTFTNIPSVIEWTNTRFQVAPARYPQETVPAVHNEISEQIPTLRQRIEVIGKPATYKTIDKPIVMKDAHRIWKKDCVAANPQQCLIQVPTKTRHIEQQIIIIPARTVQIKTPEQTAQLKRKILTSPGKGSGTPIPAQYKEIKIGRVSKTWQILSKHQPSRFEEIPTNVMIRPEIIRTTATICPDKTNRAQVRAIQSRLNKQGYQSPINGVLDTQTQQAIIKFQQDNALFIGAITLETLRKLGFN